VTGKSGTTNFHTVLKTTNGGLNWMDRSPTFTGCYISGMCFTSRDTGYLLGECQNELITKTTNSGDNWFPIFQDSSFIFFIYFIDNNTGYASSWHDVLKTTNGGSNWAVRFSQPNLFFESLFFPTSNTGYALIAHISNTPSFNVDISKSSDGGASWSALWTFSIQIGSQVMGLYFYDYVIGYVIYSDYPSTQTSFYKTSDGGNNWFVTENIQFTPLSKFFFSSPNTGYVIGDYGAILKTTNGGYNWVNQRQGIGGPTLNDICFTDQNTGYAVGGNGMILKTTNAGEPIGIKPIGSEIPVEYSLSQNCPNPFNPTTRIKFDISLSPLSERGAGRFVKLIIYDILGREIALLVNQYLKPGSYEVEWDGSNYPSGVYFYRLIVRDYTQTKKMALIK
jgi:photosystem II stability/assembly factor-like uncharacterized protein